MMGRAFVRNVLIATLAGLAACAAFNYAIDPYQQYRIPTSYAPRFYAAFQRYENPGLARHYDFDRIVLGSSMAENIPGSLVDEAFKGGKTINLSLSAMTAYDARRVLEVALARGTVKQVIYAPDFNSFSKGVDHSGFPQAHPGFLYDNAVWNDYPYLLSIATLRKSAEIAMDLRINRFSTDRDKPWYWANAYAFGPRFAVAGIDPKQVGKNFRDFPRTLPGMQASFRANIEPLLRDNPKTEFVFVYLPFSILVWADFVQRGELETALAFKRWSFHELQKYPNARVHDFQARTEFQGLQHYKDIYHHSPAISSRVIWEMARGQERVTAENLEAGLAQLRATALAADPVRLVDEAK
ncbi:hypothetical protein [Usitatibacter palustris]|uniref:TRAP-type C4-dicarboxylate transport system, substrate-binding protein n=1 Tax=Usitatibacter palustris TaxID=2732487 RepID=A0A6M4H8X3_9PROT|nr:hypothetical protein [Usitatibacter palustris]QJR16179.1 hypothetical protein DSM104440_03008 [Usitatibacter palustris]